MRFRIYFDEIGDGGIPEANIQSFNFVSNMFKMYAGANIVIKDIKAGLINKIKTGLGVTVEFYDTSDVEKVYSNKMAVLSFKKFMGNGIIDLIEINLISSLFFEKEVVTQAHEGSVSQIILNIFKDSLTSPEYKLDIDSTSDKSRYRYQIAETYPAFIKRLFKYAYKDNGAVFLYHDSRGELKLKGVKSFIEAEPSYVASTLSNSQWGVKIDGSNRLLNLVINDYTIDTTDSVSTSSITSKFSTELFKSQDYFIEEATFNGVCSLDNAQTKRIYPKRQDFYNWDITPEDAFALACRKGFEDTYMSYTVSITTNDFLLDSLAIGSVIYLILPYNPTELSSSGEMVNGGEGKYMVTRVRYNFHDGMFRTTADLVQVGF